MIMKSVKVERKRHVAKTITWRIVASADTWLISWLIINYIGDIQFFNANFDSEIRSKAIQAASLITILELVTKTVLYYFHERLWCNLNWINIKTTYRHIVKTFCWRLIGAVDTILLVFIVFYLLFSSTQGASVVAVSMFSIEVITKMILYYLHERAWYSSGWGVVKLSKD